MHNKLFFFERRMRKKDVKTDLQFLTLHPVSNKDEMYLLSIIFIRLGICGGHTHM